MSQTNVNIILPQSGNIVKVNGTSIRSTLNTVQLNTYPLDIPSTNSVVIGAFAGDALSAGSEGNSIIGTFAGGSITTGSSNVCIGKSSGSHITTGAGNVYIGNGTGSNVNPIGGNTFVGNQAGSSVAGANNTLIGAYAGSGGASTNSEIICIGSGAVPSTSSVVSEITLGNSGILALRCAVTSITSLSDARDKKDVTDLRAGLDFVKGLRPVEFVWDDREEYGKHDVADFGFIAQDLKAAQEDAELADVLKLVYESNPEKLEASYGKLVPILVKAVQELAAKVEQLESK
jgi:trimeric autotransporter adhesin